MQLFRPAVFLIALFALIVAAPGASAQRQWLEGEPTPLRYEIAITPDADAGVFSGEARISIETATPLEAVTLNALDLTIARASIDGVAAAVRVDEAAQTITLTPRRPIASGRHTLHFVYSGRIYDEAYGLFRVSYTADGRERRALATQFQPGDARRFAPMWDQPDRRAIFSLTVTGPSDQMPVSNMPALRTAPLSGNRTRTTFADTPSMPSYLLFLGLGDFERVSMEVDGVDLGVIVRRGQGERARYALQAGAESLRYFTEYFGIPYPLPKLDMIGVPGAGGFGAMENWGAILYFDQYLLLDANSSEADRRTVFEFVAHEVAHQWFGNLVTMAWWDDLWLNEGFASWMAAKAMEATHPDWRPWLAQQAGGTTTAMALDAREGTHPVVQTVNTIDEANLAFDTITYEKGLAVIRMLEAYIGEDDFRRGVRDYLSAHVYGNAQTEDLWRAVQAASGQPVLEIARNFTAQPGYPLLTVTGAECQGRVRSTQLSIAQRRFAMDQASRTDELWEIPVVARRLNGGAVRGVLPAQAQSALDVGPACGPYIVNAGQSGFFRVLYDRTNFTALTRNFPSLAAEDQLGLLLDYWEFGRSGDAPFSAYLELAAAIPADADGVIIQDTIADMSALVGYAAGRPSETAVRAHAIATLRPFFQRIGWDARAGESANDSIARASLIAALGALGEEPVIAEARRRVEQNDLPGPIRSAVLGVYAARADAAIYDTLLAQARGADDFVEQRRAWLRLASTRDPALARRTLELTLGEDIPRQIRIQVITAIGGNHPRMAWDFLVSHRPAVETLLDPLQRLEYPPNLAELSADPAIADELEAYAANFPEGARPTVAAAAAAIRLRAQTIAQHMPAAEAWIAQRRPRQR
ncbi:MAG: M1 family metallopeptidase [Hyphomonadaceae bacterium]|nr:M1 family metallopeptidase [Hyphomonadaceae bacterium]MBX3511024.1 M1 family metallopeptidase [Hyphomonadaceae bacterium]